MLSEIYKENLTYKAKSSELNDLIIKAKSGDEDAMLKLISTFYYKIERAIEYYENTLEITFNDVDKEDFIQESILAIINGVNSININNLKNIHLEIFLRIKGAICKCIAKLFKIKIKNIDRIDLDTDIIKSKLFENIDDYDIGYQINSDNYYVTEKIIEFIDKNLKQREQDIIYYKIFYNLTYKEIGQIFKLSEERVRVIYNSTLYRIKRKFNSNNYLVKLKNKYNLYCSKNPYIQILGKHKPEMPTNVTTKYIGYYFDLKHQKFIIYESTYKDCRSIASVYSESNAVDKMFEIASNA